MEITRTICCKLNLEPQANQLLLETQVAFNAAASWAATIAWNDQISDKRALHDAVYYPIRAQFGLGAQLSCCARDKAIEAVLATRQYHENATCPIFRATSSIRYDARTYTLLSANQVSLNTLHGRVRATLVLGLFQEQALADRKWTVGGAELVLRGAIWYLHLTQTCLAPPSKSSIGTIGGDLGIVNLCTTDDATVFTGTTVQRVREKRFRHRQRLQKCGTRNAKRRLKQNSRKERRFQKDVNHCISKALVQKAVDERDRRSDAHPSAYRRNGSTFAATTAQRLGLSAIARFCGLQGTAGRYSADPG
jgi:putative transposase